MKLLSICDTSETKPTNPTNYIAEQRTTQRNRRPKNTKLEDQAGG